MEKSTFSLSTTWRIFFPTIRGDDDDICSGGGGWAGGYFWVIQDSAFSLCWAHFCSTFVLFLMIE